MFLSLLFSQVVVHTNYISIIESIPNVIELYNKAEVVDAALYYGQTVCMLSYSDNTVEERLNYLYLKMLEKNYVMFLNKEVYNYMIPIISRYIEQNCAEEYWSKEWN